jgi:hypothetical protein
VYFSNYSNSDPFLRLTFSHLPKETCLDLPRSDFLVEFLCFLSLLSWHKTSPQPPRCDISTLATMSIIYEVLVLISRFLCSKYARMFISYCFESNTLNICCFVHQCNINFLLFIIRRHVSASHGHLQVL